MFLTSLGLCPQSPEEGRAHESNLSACQSRVRLLIVWFFNSFVPLTDRLRQDLYNLDCFCFPSFFFVAVFVIVLCKLPWFLA